MCFFKQINLCFFNVSNDILAFQTKNIVNNWKAYSSGLMFICEADTASKPFTYAFALALFQQFDLLDSQKL